MIHQSRFTLAILTSIVITILAGCGNTGESAKPVSTQEQTVQPEYSDSSSSASRQSTSRTFISSQSNNEPFVDPKADNPPLHVNEQDQFTPAKPALLGLQPGMDILEVMDKLGKAKSFFKMEETRNPVTVYEYADFSVGFNGNRKLKFVEIKNDKINPGLHGVKIGSSTKDAVNTLGLPSTKTSYVLAYESGGTILRLDVDPKLDQVLSIKLFKE
ncbi:hypothetical protein B7C51_18255 [Paenibacillus larvae subsp. pulvifaciens]|uniref:DUF4309 domain-containing protein n=1 Tax=Paenibacillus larvae subsp. pulvifaciens TaxID=1477 RepID=A0A1V0UVY3_9BACL|nr:hypothetical protein [Paenibacillus larvae]ARF69337.1 hypothetical protein B7C51_18255 [Paenibacillus larvae subsp. pulvifaciens]